MLQSRLARNILANLGGQLALLVLALVAARLIFRQLGADALGLVLFVQTVNVVLTGVLDLGVPALTIREVAAHVADDRRYVVDLVRTASTVYWAAFLALGLLLVLAARWIAVAWIHLGAMDQGSATRVIQVLGVAALTLLPRALYASICRGLQRMDLTNGIEVGSAIAQQLGIVLILANRGGLGPLVGWMSVSYLLGVTAYLVAIAFLMSPLAVIPGWSVSAIRRNAAFSSHMMAISVLSVVHTYADKLTVSKLLPAASLGWYSLANSLVARGALLTNAIADAAYPVVANLVRGANAELSSARYWQLQDLVCYLTLPLYAGAIFVSLPLFSMVFGRGVAESLVLPVAILAAGYYANATLSILYIYSLALGKPHLTSRFSLLAVVVTLPLTIAGVAAIGLPGASLGFLAYHLLFYAVGVPVYCRECPGIPAARWYRHLASVVSLGIVTYGPAWLAAERMGMTLPALSITFVIATVVFALAAFRLVGAEFRAALKTVLLRPSPRRLPHAA